MKRSWIFGGVLLAIVGVIAAIAIWGPDRDWDRHDNRVEVVQVVDDEGNSIDPGSTVIVERDRGGFFPFGLFLIPLAFFLFFGLFRWAFRGPGGGPWGPGGDGRSQWLDDWHKRQHQEMTSPTTPTGGEPS